ncbi:hydantoinase B/oxoprolinase family protein [Prauserella muralis]|uniref:Hydantoin utilization protein B n=1 Tax=Prauserella muralis TaxID=588067 RepID=A0A2V4AFW9_9PSEU|nr:hydantoinase B/oxoprolinase family protein [Prauserella muralis]PXY18822.1 hydantoin utilization protein B [Prauserella muralis]TWE28676.1 N-methylhydantoinase B [Prauserella muralis]
MTPPVSDPVGLEVRWDRLAAATDEAASTMLRTAFSTIIRESNDYTVVLMDRQGRTMAESRAGIPGFAALMSSLTALVLDRFPARDWQDGDCVITNDPWIATGHLPDIAMITPVFHRGVLVGYAGTAAHSPDIGGTPSMGATDLISEGMLIPPLRLFRAGRVEQGIKELLLANVRLPGELWGDLEAQTAAHAVCRRRAREFLDDFGEPDFERFAAEVHAVADAAMRAAVAELPDGVYRAGVDADGVEGHPTHIACAVTVSGERIAIDYTGSSAQVPFSTNSTLNYTRAYSMYPLKILLDPATRTNWGSYQAIHVSAPEGTIVNPRFPAPVVARHLTGHLLSCAIYQALAPVLPDRVIADSGGAPALRVRFAGIDDEGRPFAQMLFANAGMGASREKDGLSTTAFPTNSGSGSIEALEVTSPLRFVRKELRAGSGGRGRRRGGLGQDVEVHNPTSRAVQMVLLGDRERHPALGLDGGQPGATAQAVLESGQRVPLKSISQLAPGASVLISFPGGGGFGPPQDREPQLVLADELGGYVAPSNTERHP